jgi:hypothetical protein
MSLSTSLHQNVKSSININGTTANKEVFLVLSSSKVDSSLRTLYCLYPHDFVNQIGISVSQITPAFNFCVTDYPAF